MMQQSAVAASPPIAATSSEPTPATLRKEAKRRERELIDSTRPYTVESTWRSWWELVSTFAVLAGFLVGAALLPQWWARLVASIGAGLTAVRGFILYHDYLHNALLRKSRFANVIFWVYGLVLLTPPRVWRQTHNYHHAHNSKIVGSHVGSFPILTVPMYLAATKTQRLLYRLIRHPINICLGYLTIFAFGMCISPMLRDPKRHWHGGLALVLHLALLLALGFVGGWQLPLFVVVIPLAVACALGSYLFYAQHNFPDMHVQPRETWSFTRAAVQSSSYMELGPVLRWFTGNIGYHHVHHLNPTIPFYRLPAAMNAIAELQNPGRTTLWPSDVIKCIQCKLWDPELGKMVGYP